jgi:hypothetical protein
VGDTAAAHRRARESLVAGRFNAALEFYRQLHESQWEADDCLALSSALLGQDRFVSGWAALEAARRIDPKNTDAARAIEGIRSKLASAAGPDRDMLRDAADRVESLQAIAGGPPLALLVAGLARFASDIEHEDELLDRLAIAEAADLRRVNSLVAAINLIGRLLLETGRASEAQDLLGPLVSASISHSNEAAAKPTTDRETAWLLSRAALQRQQPATADAMLRMAGEFGQNASSGAEPSPFVGSKRCGDCHGAIYRDQQFASHHAATLRFGTDLRDVPLPTGPVADPRLPGVMHKFARLADDRIELAVMEDDRVQRAIVEYAVGSGHQGITMIAKDEQGIDRSLRISYLHDGPTWTETKGANSAPGEPGEKIGLALGAKSLRHCLHCHATWYRAVELTGRGPRGPEARDHGIGCERCHGPGLNHVRAVESGFADLAIALTSATPSLRRLKSCTECHAADGSLQPSDPEFTRAQGTTLLFSRCFTASKDRFGCTTCHDPHKVLETAIPTYETKCLSCHASAVPREKASSPGDGTKTETSRAPVCPVNATAQCISCHMPKVDDPSRRARFTDHHIRIHRDPGAVNSVKAQR